MRVFLVSTFVPAILACGCGPPAGVSPYAGPAPQFQTSPIHVSGGQPLAVWETVADVVDDYFPDFAQEQPLRQVGQVITEGRLETVPRGSPTMFEPWRQDATDGYQDVENTLQSIRRYAVVHVIPDESGYLIDLAVYKELEDVRRPEQSTAGAATLRYDESLRRIENPVGDQPIHAGWIPQGRDSVLERKMLDHLASRLGASTVVLGGPASASDAPLEPIPMTHPPGSGAAAPSLPPVDDRPLVPVP